MLCELERDIYVNVILSITIQPLYSHTPYFLTISFSNSINFVNIGPYIIEKMHYYYKPVYILLIII